MGETTAIRDAATVILLRHKGGVPHVLMGQRGAQAAFMPSKYVFPGGAVDADDAEVRPARSLEPSVAAALSERSARSPAMLAAAAVRELWEEAGLRLSRPSQEVPLWPGFGDDGHGPDFAAMRFVFRAVTPPGRPRRFDARFFLVEAGALIGDPDDFSSAEDELSYLHWIALSEARSLALPFITDVVLSEVEEIVRDGWHPARPIPFFDHDATRSHVHMLGGA